MLPVGLTGGIASGKSTVAQHFEAKGVPVLDADAVARDVVLPGTPGLQAIVERFGEHVLDADGALDRAAMRQQVFADATARKDLEAIIHPAVRQAMAQWSARQTSAYALLMIPLLVESGLTTMIDQLVVVDVPADVQKQRLLARDDIDASLADSMIAAQATREQRLAAADHVIDNSGTVDELAPQTDSVHQALLATAEATTNSLQSRDSSAAS